MRMQNKNHLKCKSVWKIIEFEKGGLWKIIDFSYLVEIFVEIRQHYISDEHTYDPVRSHIWVVYV